MIRCSECAQSKPCSRMNLRKMKFKMHAHACSHEIRWISFIFVILPSVRLASSWFEFCKIFNIRCSERIFQQKKHLNALCSMHTNVDTVFPRHWLMHIECVCHVREIDYILFCSCFFCSCGNSTSTSLYTHIIILKPRNEKLNASNSICGRMEP